MDVMIAQRIKELRLGLNGCRVHTYSAVAEKVVGEELQYDGAALCHHAAEELGETEYDWDIQLEEKLG